MANRPSWFSRKAKYLAVGAALLLALANGDPLRIAAVNALGAFVSAQ
jgi:hypothetical protein